MNTKEKLVKALLGMLALAEQLQNISVACERAGISCSHYYDIKKAFETFGAECPAPLTRRKPRMPNQTLPELGQRILEMAKQYPCSLTPNSEVFRQAVDLRFGANLP